MSATATAAPTAIRRDVTGRPVDVRKLPPFDDATPAAIREATEEHQEAHLAYADAARTLADLEANGCEVAEAQDAQAFAEAHAEGRKDPGRVNAQKFEVTLANARHKAAGTKIVMDTKLTLLEAALSEHGDAWLEAVNERELPAYERYMALIAQVQEAANEVTHLMATAAFLRGQRFKLGQPTVLVNGDERRLVSAVLADLEDLNGRAARPATPYRLDRPL